MYRFIDTAFRQNLGWLTATALLVGFSSTAADEPPFTSGSTTLVVLPDTERYSDDFPHFFEAQTEWIARQHRKRNIVYTIHLGDITQRNAPAHWDVAKRSFGKIDGLVPYALAPGNHDYDGNAPKRETSHLTKYFPIESFKKWPSYGGLFEKNKLDSSYHLTRIGQQDWLILVLEMGPRDSVVEWANDVLKRYPNHLSIIVTHAYLFRNNVRYDHTKGKQRASPHGWGNDGEELWQNLVRRHPGVMIVLSGHVSTGGLGYLVSEGDYGNTVHQMMVDYEKSRGGGEAFLRLLEFLPDGETVQVRTYSPAVKRSKQSELEEFQFKLGRATRKTPKPVEPGGSAELARSPTHRYRFSGKGDARVKDSLGKAHGTLKVGDSKSKLNGRGQLELDGNGHVALPPRLLKGLDDISFELWFTPTAERYKWNSVVRFGSRDDWLTYVFRTRDVHRAEIAVARHNEDIQRQVRVEAGKPLHVVVTYDHDGADGKPLLSYYRDGTLIGSMRTGLKLTDVKDSGNVIGPFAGQFDELRIYDYSLSLPEVRGNFRRGPESLKIAKD